MHPGTVPHDIVYASINSISECGQNENFSDLDSIKERAKKLTLYKVMKNKSLDKDTIIQTFGLSQDEDLEDYSKADFE